MNKTNIYDIIICINIVSFVLGQHETIFIHISMKSGYDLWKNLKLRFIGKGILIK